MWYDIANCPLVIMIQFRSTYQLYHRIRGKNETTRLATVSSTTALASRKHKAIA